MSNPSLHDRLLKEARAYIPNILRVCINDCSDSGEEAERYLNRFNALADDKIKIGSFIKDNLLEDWKAAVLDTIRGDRSLEELIADGWPVIDPPAPLDDLTLLKD